MVPYEIFYEVFVLTWAFMHFGLSDLRLLLHLFRNNQILKSLLFVHVIWVFVFWIALLQSLLAHSRLLVNYFRNWQQLIIVFAAAITLRFPVVQVSSGVTVQEFGCTLLVFYIDLVCNCVLSLIYFSRYLVLPGVVIIVLYKLFSLDRVSQIHHRLVGGWVIMELILVGVIDDGSCW